MSESIPETLYRADLESLELVHSGKVRDIYAVDADHLLIVTTDRLSAFDVVLPDPIPGKGRVLTEVSSFWFRQLADRVPNHLADIPLEEAIPDPAERERVRGRAVVVRRLRALPVEAIVRGYLIGSGWKDYQASGAVCGIDLPAGLRQAERLPEPIFTPSTKAAVGDHDENIAFEGVVEAVGERLANEIREVSLAIYARAAEYARERGIIIADTKFEFGVDENDRLVLIDEALTPDSSRFWPADRYRVGESPESFDKQYVRDYLESLDWDKTAPGPRLPRDVIDRTAAKYREARDRLLGARDSDRALDHLVQGFREFRRQHYVEDRGPFDRLVREGQKPKVLLIACSDSRVDPAFTLGVQPGEVFVIRNVANLVPPCEHDSAQHGASAALEYAVRILEVEHIVVMGHAHCGGIRALIDQPEAMRPDSESFIERWMSLAAPAYWRARERHPAADDDQLACECEKDSVLLSLKHLATFPWVRERLEAGELKLHGWYFDLVHGQLRIFDEDTRRFEPVDAPPDFS